MNNQLYIYDCLCAKLRVSDGNFMTIGNEDTNTFHIKMAVDNGGSFVQREETCRFFPHSKITSYSVNGERPKADFLIYPQNMYMFILGGGCFLAWYGDAAHRPDFAQLNPRFWYIFNRKMQEWKGPFPLQQLPEEAAGMAADDLVTFQGLNEKAFYLKDVLEAAQFSQGLSHQGEDDALWRQVEDGEFRCPNCWETFRTQEALVIAGSPDLCGDDILGEDALKRFVPTEFDERGLPLDAKQCPCSDYACPHCRMKLPPFFNETRQHILSIVGVPAAGKSYYMAALIRELEMEFPREFGMPFRDADPANNAPLNDMRMRLFSARTPQEAYIGKTRLQGRLYQKVWRKGHFSNMPRPFIYNLNKGSSSYSLVLYDNAGENYEPGRDTVQIQAANHISISSGILFLFDPTSNPGFRSVLKEHADPQLRHILFMPGRQTTLLAETEMRLRKRLNMPPHEKLNIPLAVIIGKCDTWSHLLGPEPLLPIIRNGMYVPDHVNINSLRIRQLVFNVAPNVCTNAEAISNNVRYFAVSSLGASPVEFTDETTGATLIGPASGEVHPFRVTDPIFWALSNIEPSLLPSSQH